MVKLCLGTLVQIICNLSLYREPNENLFGLYKQLVTTLQSIIFMGFVRRSYKSSLLCKSHI